MSMDDEIEVDLTAEEVIQRAESMADKMAHVEQLREKKKKDAKSTQALIDAELDEMQRLGRVIRGAREMRKQGDLFVGQAAATQALGQVAAHAPDLGEALNAEAAPAPPVPTEVHVFTAKAEGVDECTTCGSKGADPIHPHVFVAREFDVSRVAEGEPLPPDSLCLTCDRRLDHPVHVSIADVATIVAVAQGDAAPPPETFTCSTCNQPKERSAGVWLTGDLQAVCTPCHDQAVIDGKWPHPPAEDEALVENGAKLCRLCLRPVDDATIHDRGLSSAPSAVPFDEHAAGGGLEGVTLRDGDTLEATTTVADGVASTAVDSVTRNGHHAPTAHELAEEAASRQVADPPADPPPPAEDEPPADGAPADLAIESSAPATPSGGRGKRKR